MELEIYEKEDRLTVAQILIKNGYTVTNCKKPSDKSKQVIYYLKVTKDDESAFAIK